uniref:Uncharacterized protein n=1 Tax=Chrysemys picta bellii TaxID=8478 RepID=A0A8C3HX92_CHRPI
ALPCLCLPGLCIALCLGGTVAQNNGTTEDCNNHMLCPANAKCVNNTHCTCLDGYQSHGNHPVFFTDPTEICDDINECLGLIPPDCGPHAKCTNVAGSYYCTCMYGYESSSGKANFMYARENTCQDPPTHTQIVTLRFSALLTSTSLWDGGDKREVESAVTILLQSVELATLATALRSPERTTQNVTTESMAVETRLVTGNCSRDSEVFTLRAHEETMVVHCDTGSSPLPAGLGAAAFISYSTLDSIISARRLSEGNLPAGGKLEKSYLNSRVVSGAIGDGRPIHLSRPANFTLRHRQVREGRASQALCVYWKVVAESGSWSPDGCTAVHTNSTHTTCSCDHLSSFAVLMAPTTESYPLTIITYVGLTLSLLCLFLAILTFLLCRSIHNVSTSLHLQLCLCLFLANLLFLTPVACAVIAGLLHYLFLACFSWMLLEGLHLFLTVRNLKVMNYTSASRFKKRFMYPFGYGFPALVVAISAAVNPDGYGTSKHCWLSLDRGFRLSFLRPVCAIILVDPPDPIALHRLIVTGSLHLPLTRLLTFKAIAQLFILGCTWSLGLLQVDPAATVMAYLFTIVNSLQGAFIFLVHCLLNRQVREEYRRWIKGFRTSSTKSQTSDLSITPTGISWDSIGEQDYRKTLATITGHVTARGVYTMECYMP